jgi:hypothetical protein
MAKVEILNAERHAGLKIDTGHGLQFDDVSPMVSVLADELPQLVRDYPVFITKNPNTGEFELSALMGFSLNENLFINGSEWTASYIPLDVRRQPFQACLIGDGGSSSIDELDDSADIKVGINVQSNRVGRDDGELLFNSDGSATKLVENISNVLAVFLSGSKATKLFLKYLSDYKLIAPVKLDAEFGDQKKIAFDGLFTVNHDGLSQLSDAQVLAFHRNGYFQACYSLLNSHGHLQKLIDWKSRLSV